MKRFFSFIIKQSVAIVLIVIFVLGFGIYSTSKMSVNLLPDISIPMVCVQVIYPGVGAQSVEKDVTEKLEDGLSSISGITCVDSYSYDNLSAVVLSFDYGTDTKEKKSDIQSKLNSMDLPESVITSVYDIDLNAEALATLSITSNAGATDDDKLANAYAAAEDVAAKISAIDGVESVEIKGGAETFFEITPYGGLELIAPLIVQAFSYGKLDLPLGNLTQNGETVQIRNNSDIAKLEDIQNMPLSLPSSMVTLLSSVKQVMRYYEDDTAVELETLQTDLGAGVLAVLRELSTMPLDEVEKLAELKTYMNIAGYTSDELSRIKRLPMYKAIEDSVADRDDLDVLAKEINDAYSAVLPFEVTEDFLRVIKDGKLDDVIAFRRDYVETKPDYNPDEYYKLSNEDYLLLARCLGVYGEETDDETVLENVEFVKQTSAAGLSNIANKKKEEGNDYNPTDAECALLFAGTTLSDKHRIITSPTFMAFVRNENYEENMQTLIDCRREVGDGVELTAEQWFKLYESLDLEGVFEFKLSEKLFGFIMTTDFTDLVGGEKVVKVSEIASVHTRDTFNSYVYFGDGKAKVIKGAIIEVYKSNGANSSHVVDEVKKIYAEYLSGNDNHGAKVVLLDDQSEFISDSISNVLVSMIIGGVLAVLIIFMFLKKLRTSLIVAITMPLSVLAALICLYLMGITLNMVSLGGLAVGIGMLVDNSIVVIESISKHRDMDKTAFEAAVGGTAEVGGALFGSTLTTVCVFIPIIFSGGLTGEIFTDLSWAVIWSLAFSLIVAVTVIPALYALFGGGKRLLKGGKLTKRLTAEPQAEISVDPHICANEVQISDKKLKKSVKEKLSVLKQSKIMDSITNFYGKILPAVLNKKLVTVLAAVVVFGASIGLLFLTGTEFLPSIDKGQIEVNMTYGSSADLAEVESDVFAFAETIQKEIPNIDYVSVSVGKHGLLALTDTGLIKVQLTTNRGTDKVVEQIRALSADENKPVGTVTVKEIDGVVASLMSGSDDLSVTIVGEDGETLKNIADEISAKLEENDFTDVKNSSTETATEYSLKFDRNKMAELGLDYQTLVLTLRIGLASYTACTVTIDDEVYDLNVKFDENSVTFVDELKDFVVGADSDGKAVKLRHICGVTENKAEASIRKTDGKQMISVSAALPGVDTGTASKKMQKIAQDVLSNPEYADYGFESSGISSYLTDAFKGLAVALVISFFLLFAVMAVQFSSAVKPLIIMASIPFSFTGGFIALVITGTSLNVVSFIGLIMLMGVVVNNAIVMLEKIKQLHDEGMEHFAAVQAACKVRLRPIFMTTLTTILALMPLAIGVGQGSELMQPLGIVVIGGLLIGTLVTLLLVPAVYCAVHRLSSKSPDGKRSA